MIFESDCLLNISVSNNLVKNYLQWWKQRMTKSEGWCLVTAVHTLFKQKGKQILQHDFTTLVNH